MRSRHVVTEQRITVPIEVQADLTDLAGISRRVTQLVTGKRKLRARQNDQNQPSQG